MLRSGRSFFGVRARGEGSKGYAEKGAPTKNLLSRKSLAAASTENRRSANEPAKTLKWAYNSAGRCPRFSPHSVGRKEILPPLRSCSLHSASSHSAHISAALGSVSTVIFPARR